MTIINIHVFFWVGLTFFVFLITASNVKGHKLIMTGDSVPKALTSDKLNIEHSFYKADATLHDVIFFHASASGVAVVLLVLIIKGEVLFPGTVIFFGAASSLAIFAIRTVLLLLAFYFYTISILKLGDTLARLKIDGKDVNTLYALLAVFGYFLIFPIMALILV
ncbi:hypothetical protein KPY62_10450 [Psychrobacter sp. TAE2020]|uniref:hypothetical protein n=1 Tax=Psychrobacter sp. TAE2020 TaxID=2846762 RepID=UPI001C11F89B|nr:hypothetical protein [Psychrobacter sp. TAE2020]MBU5617500.1 hypothetical protein [Psychrobacter sp. TAE2020]